MAKKFLSYMSLKRLYELKKKETDSKSEKRLHACILRKEGKTLMEISDAMKVPYTTVQNWIARISKNGIRDRCDKKAPGATCKLDKEQLEQLMQDLKKGPEKCGYDTTMWTMILVRRHIKKTFGVEYNVVSVWGLVKRLGFHRATPRPKNYKAASPDQIKKFKKKAHRKVVYWSHKGYLPMAIDATHKLIGLTPKKGWYKEKNPTYVIGGKATKRKAPPKKVKGKKKKKTGITLLGAIGPCAESYFRFYDAGNWINVKNFLLGIHKKFGKVLLFLDNASYHRKLQLERLTKETGGDLKFEFFLPYTPELNPIETQWAAIKLALSGKFTRNLSEIKAVIRRLIGKKIVPIVKMHDYLMP